jgi:hypothetical protein
VFDAGALVETGFAGGRGTLLLGGRYSYTAAILSVLVPDVKLDYRDYQARVSYDIGGGHRLSFFSFGSYDLLAQRQGGGLNVLFGSEFYRLDVRHDLSFAKGDLRTAVTLGYDQSHQGDEGKAIARSLGARMELRQELGARALLRAGVDVVFDDFSSSPPRYVDPESPEVTAFERNNPARTDRAGGFRADVVLHPTNGVEVTPGVRVDFFRSQSASAVAVEPRISARFAVGERVALVHAYGLVHQPPSFVLPLPGRTPAGLDGGLQRALQGSAGVEVDLGDATSVKGTLFYNAFFEMSDALASVEDGPPDARPVERSLGSAYGLEVFLNRRLTKRLGGFLSYTLSRSTRSIGRERFPSTFDRTHVANAAVAYDLGRNWRAGTRLVFYTGTPQIEEPNGLLPEPRDESPPRNAPFYRVDVRVEKRWNLSREVWLSFVAEVLNATLTKETFGSTQIGPLTIPSLGAELGF